MEPGNQRAWPGLIQFVFCCFYLTLSHEYLPHFLFSAFYEYILRATYLKYGPNDSALKADMCKHGGDLGLLLNVYF